MVTNETDGSHLFRIYLPHASSVELIGSFSGWQQGTLEMRRCERETGWWETRQQLPQGDHEFSYLVDGRCWMPDYAANGVKRNHYGNWISMLHVHQAPKRQQELEPVSVLDRFARQESAVRSGRRGSDARDMDLIEHGR